MAVCEIWDVRGRLDHPIDYAENPEKTANPKYSEADLQAMVDVMEYATNADKTEQRFFVTGVNCEIATARDEMMIAKAQWNDESEIVCYDKLSSSQTSNALNKVSAVQMSRSLCSSFGSVAFCTGFLDISSHFTP